VLETALRTEAWEFWRWISCSFELSLRATFCFFETTVDGMTVELILGYNLN